MVARLRFRRPSPLKYRYLFTVPLPDFKAVMAFLPTAIATYNNRPHTVLYCFTPWEDCQGALLDPTRFRGQIDQAVQKRLDANMKAVYRP